MQPIHLPCRMDSPSSSLSPPPPTRPTVLVPTSSLSQPTSSSSTSSLDGPPPAYSSQQALPPSSSVDDGARSSYEPSQPDDDDDEQDEQAFHLFQPLPTQLQAQPTPTPPLPPPSSTDESPFAQALDQAYLRYLQAIDEIAEKYKNVSDEDEVVEVEFGDMVEGMVDRLREHVQEEEGAPTGGEGEEEAEVGEGEGEEEEKREVEVVLMTQRQKAGWGGGSDKGKERSDKLFREDANPTWCWVEPNSPSSSELITSLLQSGASLTPSLQSASHVLLSTSSTSTLSSLQRSILETKLPGQWIVSFDWVRDCLTTGVRLREVGYEVRWGGHGREEEGRRCGKGKGRERDGDLLGARRGKGVSSTAPGRMSRDEVHGGRSTSDLVIPAFKSIPKPGSPPRNPTPIPTLAPPTPPPLTNAVASSSKLPPASTYNKGGLPPPLSLHKPTPSSSLKFKPDPLPLLALPIPPRPSNLLLPTSSSSHKTNPPSSFSLLGSMPPPPLPPLIPKPNQYQPSTSSKKRPVADQQQQQPTTTTTKRARHLGLGAGMSKLSKVPSLLSSIRGVALGGGGGERKEGS